MIYKLREHKIQCTEFREPDIGNEMTAVATIVNDEDRRYFRNLKLV